MQQLTAGSETANKGLQGSRRRRSFGKAPPSTLEEKHPDHNPAMTWSSGEESVTHSASVLPSLLPSGRQRGTVV